KGDADLKVIKETPKPEAEGTPDELDQELVTPGDGPALGEDITPEEAPEEATEEAEEETPEVVLPERPEGVTDQDWKIFVKRHHGVTWRACAEAEGWDWHKTNMDGGRAL